MYICPTVGGGSVSNMLNTHIAVLVSIKHVEYARYTVISSITFSPEFSYYTLIAAVTSSGVSQPTILAGSSWILCTDTSTRQRLHSVALCFAVIFSTVSPSTIDQMMSCFLILWGIQLLSVQFCSVLYCAVLFCYCTIDVYYVDVITSQKLWLHYYICVYIMYQGVEAFDHS